MGIASKIRPLQDDVDFVNILVYADSGTGKTVFAGTDDRVLFIAPEDSGTISAKRFGSKADKWPILSWDDLLEAYDYLYEQIEENGKLPYDWICIDSLTEMQSMAMRFILDTRGEDAKGDPDIPQLQDWQKYYIIFEKMVRAFNDLEVNVLYTALAKKVEDADGEDFYTPDIQGKDYMLSQKIASLTTSYGHMRMTTKPKLDAEGKETGKKIRVRRIHWEDTGASRGKDRTRTLAPFTDNLTLKQIREKINGFEQPAPKKAVAKKVAPTKAAPAKAAPAKAEPGVRPKPKGETAQEKPPVPKENPASKQEEIVADLSDADHFKTEDTKN